MEKNRSLQGMRGVSMLAIFLLHIHDGVKTAGISPGFDEQSIAYDLYLTCHRGVDLFFLISGFIIPACLARQGTRKFLLGRAKRIYPTFLVPHLLVFTIGPAIGYKWMQGLSLGEYVLHFFSNVFFLPGIFVLPIGQVVAWTLSYDIAFYLLAAAAYALWRTSSPGGARPKLVKLTLWGAWLSIALGIVLYAPRGYECWFFVAGVLTYAVREHLGWRPESRWLVGIVGPAALVLLCLSFTKCFVLSPVFGFLFLTILASQRGWTTPLLHHRVTQYLGDISYSFYLWHSMVIFGTKRFFAHYADRIGNEGLTVAAFAGVTLILSWMVAHVSYRVCEQWVTSKLSPKKTTPSTDAAKPRRRSIRIDPAALIPALRARRSSSKLAGGAKADPANRVVQ